VTTAGTPPPSDWGQSSRLVAGRFVLDDSDLEGKPRRAQWLRDWWWSGTRTQRRITALIVPVSLLLGVGTWGALALDLSREPADPPTAASSTTGPTTAGTSSTSSAPSQTRTQIGNVTTVVDGNTIVVVSAGVSETIRLIGIDAPEMAGSEAGQQCWAAESAQFASDTLLQQEVQLVPDPSQGATDSSGVRYAYVLLPDGRDFSVLSAGAGQARSYTDVRPAIKSEEIAEAEEEARTASRGLWGEPCNGGLSMPAPVTTTPSTTVPSPPPPPPPPTPPPPPPTDPRFDNCFRARQAGYGPYVMGTDPEYYWYPDVDGDGIACERIGD